MTEQELNKIKERYCVDTLHNPNIDDVMRLVSELVTHDLPNLLAEVTRMREYFNKYAEHDAECECSPRPGQPMEYEHVSAECTCGLDDIRKRRR